MVNDKLFKLDLDKPIQDSFLCKAFCINLAVHVLFRYFLSMNNKILINLLILGQVKDKYLVLE